MVLRRTVILLFGCLVHGIHIPSSSQYFNKIARSNISSYEPIRTGYVAFGDSYAAGIGAGSTSGDGCRVGTASYPSQLNAWVSSLQPGVDYQNLPCSGAVVTEVLQGGDKSQIDKWTNPGNADRATLSIGGNDVGFYNILTACVLRVGQAFAGDCDYWINQAYTIMQSADFHNNVDNALRQILAKSGRNDFRIIQTGYPAFFNAVTDSCDYTTFYFWQPGHHWIHRGAGWAYLYKSLRVKLNALVADLNSELIAIIDGVNKDYAETRVIFADPNPAFEGHRFCEEGITEPDPSNQDNWLFLASWPDYSVSGDFLTSGNSSVSANSPASNSSSGQITEVFGMQIPDAATCANSHDWSDLMLCEMGQAGIAYNLQDGIGLESQIELPDGTNLSTSEVGYLIPTNYAKTFHPRSRGHLAYRDLVRGIW